MPTIHSDRTPEATARLNKALGLLKRRNGADAPRQGATISELCRLAGVSRNAIYRYHPKILAALRRLQGRPADPPGQWARSAHAVDHARLQDQLSKLAALVDITTPPTARRAPCLIVGIDSSPNSGAS
jgi:AcrR family transcriptional regulator